MQCRDILSQTQNNHNCFSLSHFNCLSVWFIIFAHVTTWTKVFFYPWEIYPIDMHLYTGRKFYKFGLHGRTPTQIDWVKCNPHCVVYSYETTVNSTTLQAWLNTFPICQSIPMSSFNTRHDDNVYSAFLPLLFWHCCCWLVRSSSMDVEVSRKLCSFCIIASPRSWTCVYVYVMDPRSMSNR